MWWSDFVGPDRTCAFRAAKDRQMMLPTNRLFHEIPGRVVAGKFKARCSLVGLEPLCQYYHASEMLEAKGVWASAHRDYYDNVREHPEGAALDILVRNQSENLGELVVASLDNSSAASYHANQPIGI
ncbi:hypothetical protein EVAR_69531_1 [Eumeta japonica]|uniref:Uncharacterized protein n=1 Tax=Eumeta variegata TaxID=151549 RepID=A0A4C1SK10_EUMVA|nr:hypothetical protein EVAR_69531_1 [Eumeta japonica]